MNVKWHRNESGKLRIFDMPELLRQSNDGSFPDGRMLKAQVDEIEVHVLAPAYMSDDELEASLVHLNSLAISAAESARRL